MSLTNNFYIQTLFLFFYQTLRFEHQQPIYSFCTQDLPNYKVFYSRPQNLTPESLNGTKFLQNSESSHCLTNTKETFRKKNLLAGENKEFELSNTLRESLFYHKLLHFENELARLSLKFVQISKRCRNFFQTQGTREFYTIEIMSMQTLKGLSFVNIIENREEEQLESFHLEGGLSLEMFNEACETDPSILTLTCAPFISQMEGLSNKEVRLGGSGQGALLGSLSFILMALGCKQVKFYPHLITLIREQFFRPGLFVQYDSSHRNRIFNICRNIEIELISSGGITEFFENNEEFLFAFQYVLEQILESSEPTNQTSEIIEIIRKKFNIDCLPLTIENSKAMCWVFGMQKKIYLFEESDSYIIVSSSTSTEPSRSMIESTHENKFESEKEHSEGGYQMIIEASEESTPKFKENQESIKYRKKSHKNSFGGDFDISGYKELANLVNKSQNDGEKDFQSIERKVFSMKYEFNEKGLLESQSQIITNKDHEDCQNEAIKNDPQLTKTLVLMRGSSIEGNQYGKNEKEGEKTEKGERKKHITSSEIFNLMNTTAKLTEKTKEPEKNVTKNNGQKECSRVSEIGEMNIESEVEHNPEEGENAANYTPTAFNLLNPMDTLMKENFKFSFSKKDQGRFIFKEIESEYNDNEQSEESELEYRQELNTVDNRKPLRSSLMHLKSNTNSDLGLLHEGHYFRKNEKNKRLNLLEDSVNPIQEEQSSQRERTESVTQSHKETDAFEQHEEMEKKSINSYQIPQNSQNTNTEPKKELPNHLINANSKHFYSALKNRKFSYLTQPMNSSKNWVSGEKEDAQENSVLEENETIPESPSCLEGSKHNSPKHFLNGKSKNRVAKSPKTHKNSEAIGEKSKKRFEENPISFSQMIANIHEDSNISMHGLSNRNKIAVRLSLCSNVHSFLKDNSFSYQEPERWFHKEVIYHFNDYRKPERFILMNKKYENKENNSMRIKKEVPTVEATSCHMNLNVPVQPTQSAQPQNMNIYNINVENYHYNVLSPPQNIRSTLDSVLPLSTLTPEPIASWQTLSHSEHNEHDAKGENKTNLSTNQQQKNQTKLHFLSNLKKDKDNHKSHKKVRNKSIEYIASEQKKNIEFIKNKKKEYPTKDKKIYDRKVRDIKSPHRESQSPIKELKIQGNVENNPQQTIFPLPQEGLSVLPSYLSLMNLRENKQRSPIKERSRERKYTDFYSSNTNNISTQPPLSAHGTHSVQGSNNLIKNNQNNMAVHPQCFVSPQGRYEIKKDNFDQFLDIGKNGIVNSTLNHVKQPTPHHFTQTHSYVAHGNVRTIF